jgi:hypothetical protein
MLCQGTTFRRDHLVVEIMFLIRAIEQGHEPMVKDIQEIPEGGILAPDTFEKAFRVMGW